MPIFTGNTRELNIASLDAFEWTWWKYSDSEPGKVGDLSF
jgi:hypothetical protein